MEEPKKVVAELVENYRFKITFPDSAGTILYMDEPPPLGQANGPNAAKVLAAAVANCLSASLVFCLRKSRIDVKGIKTEAEPIIERNEQGYWRVKTINVFLYPQIGEDVEKEKVRRCINIFENYCVVTGAVRSGIKVNVNVRGDLAEKL